jgi:predicted dehydrogenase
MIKWGFLGTSDIAHTMARAAKSTVYSQLYAIAGRNIEKLDIMSKSFRFKKVYNNYDELLTDPAVDVVYIALPNHLHAEWIKKAALANKAILCEKPLCYDYKQTQAALTMVDNQRVFCMEALMYRCHPFIDSLIELLQTDAIGDIQHIDAYYHADIHEVANPQGGGTILNLGCYPLSLVQLIVKKCYGEFAFNQLKFKVQGFVANKNVRRAQAILTVNNGITANISTADDLPFAWHFDVVGSSGRIRAIDNPFLPACDKNQWLLTTAEGKQKIIDVESCGDAYTYQVLMVESCFKTKVIEAKNNAPSCMDSVQIMQVLDSWRSQILKDQQVQRQNIPKKPQNA